MPRFLQRGSSILIDEHGYLLNGNQWTPEIAELLARNSGIDALTDRHWSVIALCREDAARRGTTPRGARIEELSGLSREELQRLFRGDPENTITRISGLPRPHDAGTAHPTSEEAES